MTFPSLLTVLGDFIYLGLCEFNEIKPSYNIGDVQLMISNITLSRICPPPIIVHVHSEGYRRVSTTEQTSENQSIAIRQKGYEVNESCVISETVSDSVETTKHDKFKMLFNHKIESCDMLVASPLLVYVVSIPF